MKTTISGRRQLRLLLAVCLFGGLSACGGGGGSSADATLKIGTPLAEAVDANGQPSTLDAQGVVQPTITLKH